MGRQQGSAAGRRGIGRIRVSQDMRGGDRAAKARELARVLVRQRHVLRIVVIGMTDTGVVAGRVVVVMGLAAADDMPMHNRVVVAVCMQVREGQEPGQRNRNGGDGRENASGRGGRHDVRSMSARAQQSQTSSGNTPPGGE